MAIDERVVWTGHPGMFRNAPVGFLLALLLIPLGIGLVVLLIWYLRCLATTWTVTTCRAIARQGLLSKSTTELRHADIRAIHVDQGFFQRLLGTGTVRVSSASSDDYGIQMAGVANPEQVANTLRGLQERRDLPERPMSPPPARVGASFASPPFATSQVQPHAAITAQPVGAATAGPSGERLRKVGRIIALVGTQAGPWTVATLDRACTHIRATPKKIDNLLKSTAGEGNDLIYRFCQAATVGVFALMGFGVLGILWLTSWLWFCVPCLAVLVGLVLLFVGGKSVERSRTAGGGIAGVGLVMVVLGVPLAGLHLSNSIAKQRQEREARQANEEVALLVRTAQENFDKGDLDKAETELQRVSLVARATDTKAAGLLQDKIRTARQEAAIRKANRDVLELVAQGEMDFSSSRLQAAEEELSRALSVPLATDTAKARELLGKVSARRQELANEKANRDVSELVRQAENDFSSRKLEAAEEKLSKALSVPLATDTAKAKELLAKISARRQELANEKVTGLIADAKDMFRASQHDKAMRIINEAIAVKEATNNGEAERVLGQIGNAQPELLLRDAEQAIEQSKYSVAAKRLAAYHAHARSEKKPEASRMLQLLELVLDNNGDKSRQYAKSMSDEQLKSLADSGKLPNDLASTSAALNDAANGVLIRYVPAERSRRQAEQEAAQAKAREALAQLNAEREKKRQAETGHKVEAWVVAQEFVERRLKSPSTASYGGLFGGQTADTCVTPLGNRRYRVRGWVDAKNAFGATLRADFSMVLTEDESGKWSGEDIVVEQR